MYPLLAPYPKFIDVENKKVHVVAGVIRYYDSISSWDLLSNQDSNHYPINVDSVSADSNVITVNFDTDNWGLNTSDDIEPAGLVAVPDETMTQEGFTLGTTVNYNNMDIEIYKQGMSDYIYYDGANWQNVEGSYAPSWFTDHLVLDRAGQAYEPLSGNKRHPIYTPRETPYIVQAGSIKKQDVGNGYNQMRYESWFYDSSGTLVTTPDTDMKFYVYEPQKSKSIDPTSSDYFSELTNGNIWFVGFFTSGNA